MTGRRLLIVVALWAALAVLASSPPGAILGVFVGFGIAMFGGLLGVLLQGVLQGLGIAVSWPEVMQALGYVGAIAWIVVVAALAIRAASGARTFGRAEAYRRLARVVQLLGASAVLALSLQSMAQNWPG